MSPDPLETLRTALSDRYRVERLLGAGGMATVYLAQDLKHDRPVAIKVLRPELSVLLGPERFHREIQIAAKLNHPHILTLHDSGEAGGLLYYVMPYVDGESLLARLAREGQLPVGDAVRITREVASALAYAHGHGVVHRDIKPANILLSNGYAMVADFGLARAISSAKSDVSITQTGLAIGSPTYMSPEQSSGAPDVDGRSDIYSLGCVLYELLTGDPPFTASTPSALMARHVSTKPLPIRPFRPSVPAGVEWAVVRALEKLPADRYQKAEEFDAALAAAVQPARPAAWTRWVTASALIVASALLVLLLSRVLPPGPPLPAVDTARYAVLPFEVSGPGAAGLAIEQLVQDALARWGGITVVDGIQVAEAVGRGGTRAALTSAEAARISGRLGAGRYIRGEVVPEGDSLRVRLALYAVGTTGRIRERSTRLGTGVSRPDSVLTDLTDQLIFPIPARNQQPSPPIGSRMLPALQSFVRADSAILLWNLEAADSLLSTALLLDPEYAQAKLWLALVRVWSGEPLARWQSEAQRAYSRSDQLSPRDRLLAEALVAQGNQDYPKACGIWRRLTRSNADSFVGWFGLATCLRRDQAVMPDSKSPSAWRFRSSYHEAVQAYRRAFELLPSIHFGLRSDGFMRLRGDILFTTGRNLRPGRALPPDTSSFYAYPEWSGDTLVFYPFPADIISRGATGRQEQRQEGVTRQRRVFLQIAQSWVASYPSSADALEALALSLELLGDASALDTLHRARSVAKSRAEALRVATSEVWVRLKFALPDDVRGLERVRALTDSLLAGADQPGAPDPALLAGIAALRGRAGLAARLAARSGTVNGISVDRALARDGPALWAYAAVGGPADTMRALEQRVASAIDVSLVADQRAPARREWLGRAASLVFPETTLQGLDEGGPADEFLKAQSAAARGRPEEALAVYKKLSAARKDVLPERLTYDAIYPESRLLAFLGADSAAIRWLDPPLAALSRTAPQALADVFNAAALVRAMALRADLAVRLGDRKGATRWARPVAILWKDADSFLLPLAQRMARLGN